MNRRSASAPNPKKTSLTLGQAYQYAREMLARSETQSPDLDARMLVCHAVGCSAVDIIADNDRTLTEEEVSSVKACAERRMKNEPVAYITGIKHFFGLEFRVGRGVLVPRPETEGIVERAIEIINARKASSFVDVGVGSGCIAISILANTAENVRAVGIDISKTALSFAALNAEKHGVMSRIRLVQSDLLTSLIDTGIKYPLIVSNPPYVAEGDFYSLMPDVRDYEPREALVAGDEGCAFIRELISQSKDVLANDGVLLIEVGEGQGFGTAQLAKDRGFRFVASHKDLSGIPRVMELTRC